MQLWVRVAVWRLREGWARLPIGVRFLWLLLGVMLGLMTPLMGAGYLYLQRSLEVHQQLVQRQRLVAIVSALERELAALLRQVQDYTVWDDAYAALSQRDTAWIRRNITEWLPEQFHYDFAVVVDSQGTVIERTAGDWEWIWQTELFQRAMRGVSSAALHRRGETIYLLAAAPFVDEACSRPPAGVLVVGRALDAPLLRRISQSAGHTGGVWVHLNPPSPRPSPPLSRGERVREWGDSIGLLTWNPLHDSMGQPIALLTVEPPRAEQAWLLNALYLAKQYLFVFGGALALIASLTMVLLLQSQLRRFSIAIQRLASGDWQARVAYPARDELGYLARAFNQMAQQLQQAFEAQEQQREELLAQKEELERVHAQLQQAHQELAALNAELLEANRALAQAAVTDGLTGLKNHRAFQESLHSAAQMAERLQQPLSLIMFDIDHFKQFNDTFGHPAGDELLRQVAQVLRESARAYDVAARYGGEEFALLLPNTTLEQAVQVAERLRQQIRAIENPHAPVSASFGVATYRHGTPPATLVYEADAALYRAKRRGRDQVCVYQPEAA